LDAKDFDLLIKQLSDLRRALSIDSKTPEHQTAIDFVSQAENAATARDGNRVISLLKSSGSWVFDVATKIGVSLITELIKHNTGI
jgi:hypothetical protein